MEDTVVLIAVGATVLIVLVTYKLIMASAAKAKLNLPPGPWTLPLIGSIHHLLTGDGVHRAMRTLAEKHGPLMQLWMGEVGTVVATSTEAAQEIMKHQDLVFADRYVTATLGNFTFDGSDIACAAYGDRWRNLRKLATTELLTATRVRSFRRIREDEVARLVQDLAASAAAGEAVNLTEKIAKVVNDTVLRCSVGTRSKYQDEFLEALHTAIRQTTGITVADLFPSFKLARKFGSAPRKALASREKIVYVIEQILQERRELMESGGLAATGGSECFVDVLLRLQKEGGSPIPIANDVIVVLLLDTFAGGSDTSSTTLNWTMAELMRSPRVLEKARAEVRNALQGKDTITEDDVAKLSYLKMVIKESLRLHCPAPLLTPRKCRENCKVMGYDVLKGTSVFVNVWAICRDPKHWEDAEEFKPERFENNTIDFKGNNFEFLPFGAGRRICPGINLGIANMELALAAFLYHFDWKLPDGMEPKDVDMRDAAGLVAAKRTSLHLYPVTHIAPRSA